MLNWAKTHLVPVRLGTLKSDRFQYSKSWFCWGSCYCSIRNLSCEAFTKWKKPILRINGIWNSEQIKIKHKYQRKKTRLVLSPGCTLRDTTYLLYCVSISTMPTKIQPVETLHPVSVHKLAKTNKQTNKQKKMANIQPSWPARSKICSSETQRVIPRGQDIQYPPG